MFFFNINSSQAKINQSLTELGADLIFLILIGTLACNIEYSHHLLSSDNSSTDAKLDLLLDLIGKLVKN